MPWCASVVVLPSNDIMSSETELLIMVCHDVETEPALQPVTGEELNRGSNQAAEARLDIHARGFWER